MKKAVGYLRVSGESQVDGDGFKRQENAIRAYAKTNRIDLIEIFREEAVSGTTDGDNRPAFKNMVGTAMVEEVRTVLIEDVSRFTRDADLLSKLTRTLHDLGIALVDTRDGRDIAAAMANGSENPHAKMRVQLDGVLAEFDKNVIVKRLREARARLRASGGKCEGPKHMKATEQGLELIAMVKKLRRKPRKAKRLTYPQVAERLNNDGVPPFRGKAWTANMVQKIMKTYGKESLSDHKE